MRRWHGHGTLAIGCRLGGKWKSFHVFRHTRLISNGNVKNKKKINTLDYQQYPVFQKTPVPESDRIEKWAALLDGALPPHLRDPKVSPPLLTLAATDLAEVLLAAQRADTNRPGHDLLYYLGFEQGRWSAVVWLIKKLIDRFPIATQRDVATMDYLSMWNQVPPFPTPLNTRSDVKAEDNSVAIDLNAGHATEQNFERPLHLETDVCRSGSEVMEASSLDELTGPPGYGVSYHQTLAHDALGQIWRTLGAMTRACAGGNIRQEVLEIIAYLHHREIMPMSIYQYLPRMDKSAIQQSPLIPLLSSRILTSLSDAAWRAHEKLMVEEARVHVGEYALKAPAVLAAPYRARVDGLFPEVWLELILWSCLHGGWVEQGGFILNTIARREDWKPLSWREYEKALPQGRQLDSSDWDAWDFLFKTRAAKSMDPLNRPIPEVQRTVSAEVVNAYIDAMASLPSDRRLSQRVKFHAVPKILQLKSFLMKQDLGLTTGSWDALAIRLVEDQVESPENSSELFCRIAALSPGLGQGLSSTNTQDLPSYVLDGGLAIQGLLNRALYGRLMTGNLEPALKVLHEMLGRTDRDKQTSMTNFMMGSKPLLRALHGDEMFTSNVTGIDYPAFNVQIPTTTLALFLDLVTQSKEYDFGHWLLYSKDADGPVIRPDHYNDPFLIPALVRFAAATQDSELFSTLRALPEFSINFVLDAQIDAMRWDAAIGIVEHISKDRDMGRSALQNTWNTNNLANLTRVMLSQVQGATAGDTGAQENLQSAMRLFSIMVEQVEPKNNYLAVKVQTLLNALASVDAYWAAFCYNLRRREGHHDFHLSTLQLNYLLEGVVTAYGSTAGRQLLRLLWPQSARRIHRASPKAVVDQRHEAEIPRLVIPLPGLSDKHRAVMYGALRPNVKTIIIILQKALEELRDHTIDETVTSQTSSNISDTLVGEEGDETSILMSRRGMVAWAARQMASLSDISSGSEVVFNLGGLLHGLGMEDLHEALPYIVRSVGMTLRDSGLHDDDDDDDVDVSDHTVSEEDSKQAGSPGDMI